MRLWAWDARGRQRSYGRATVFGVRASHAHLQFAGPPTVSASDQVDATLGHRRRIGFLSSKLASKILALCLLTEVALLRGRPNSSDSQKDQSATVSGPRHHKQYWSACRVG